MSASAAREAARTVVSRVRERNAYAHETLDAVLTRSGLDSRDAAFATRLAYGTIAFGGTLDQALGRYISDPARIEPQVGDALAVAAYEILFARTPDRAAVSQGVELVRSVQPKAAGLANAVLRKLAGEAADFPWGDATTDPVALARLHGHPEWMVRLWIDELGFEPAVAIMEANNEPAPLYVAHLPFREELDAVVSAFERAGAEPRTCALSTCIELGNPSQARSSGLLDSGSVAVADEAAQFAAQALDAKPGQRIVELGAGRGTKSLVAAGQAFRQGGQAEVTAVDVHDFKLKVLRQSVERAGAHGIETVVADATDFEKLQAAGLTDVDAVLVDAPCSGLGTLRRHPDRRWRARPDEIATVAVLGSSLLAAGARLVKVGGFVVYSTCTIARAENAAVIEGFLASDAGAGFSVDSLAAEVPEQWDRFVSTEGYFQSLPQPDGPDGHFVARLVRVS